MPKFYTQEMDSDARRSWSGNSNHRIQNHTPESLSKIKSQKRSRKKQRFSNKTEKIVKVRMEQVGIDSYVLRAVLLF